MKGKKERKRKSVFSLLQKSEEVKKRNGKRVTLHTFCFLSPHHHRHNDNDMNDFTDLEKSSAEFPLIIHEVDEYGDSRPVLELSANSTSHEHQTSQRQRGTSVYSMLVEVFLPAGYPHSVKNDYVPYQIYDSLQAFSSSIATLFANRAVLQAVGVGDDSATSTSALFMKIIQETVGRLGTIVFAWKFGATLEPECKKYRFLADIVNDSAMLFDCFAPFFPFSKPLTISVLCVSGVLRSICGVMAGGSRAALTLHFTQPERGSIADVNAKDQSQETVISLMGMVAGSVVVGIVQGDGLLMWTVLVMLLSVHLYTNYQAVSSVVMHSLNRQRTNIIFSDIIKSLEVLPNVNEEERAFTISKLILTPKKVSQRERILEKDGLVRDSEGKRIGLGKFVGITIISRMAQQANVSMLDLLKITLSHGYIIFVSFSFSLPTVVVTLLDDEDCRKASVVDRDIRAWVHVCLICEFVRKHTITTCSLDLIASTEKTLEHLFTDLDISKGLSKAGWDLTTRSIVTETMKSVKLASTGKV